MNLITKFPSIHNIHLKAAVIVLGDGMSVIILGRFFLSAAVISIEEKVSCSRTTGRLEPGFS